MEVNANVWTGTDEYGKSTGNDCSKWSLDAMLNLGYIV
jgi:hypothetical protein